MNWLGLLLYLIVKPYMFNEFFGRYFDYIMFTSYMNFYFVCIYILLKIYETRYSCPSSFQLSFQLRLYAWLLWIFW